MSFRLVDTGWNGVFMDAVLADYSNLRLVCLFIKKLDWPTLPNRKTI